MIFSLLISILLVLWFIDGYLTVSNFKKYGQDIEENPILRRLLRHNVKYFLLFKLFDAIAFIAMILLVINKSESIATLLLVAFILLYLYVNWKSYLVLKER